jgi:hypothetical protein
MLYEVSAEHRPDCQPGEPLFRIWAASFSDRPVSIVIDGADSQASSIFIPIQNP